MPFEQPADGAFVDLVAHLRLKGELYLPRRGNFPSLGLAEKRGEEGLFFFPTYR